MYGEFTKEVTIEELAERWEMLFWQLGVKKLRIIEQFPKNGLRSFNVSGLSIEFEDDYVMCMDFGEVLVNKFSVLMMFLRESLVSIKLLPIGNGLYQERLEFSDGLILIEIA